MGLRAKKTLCLEINSERGHYRTTEQSQKERGKFVEKRPEKVM